MLSLGNAELQVTRKSWRILNDAAHRLMQVACGSGGYPLKAPMIGYLKCTQNGIVRGYYMVLQMVVPAVFRIESLLSFMPFVTRVSCDKVDELGRRHSSRMLVRMT